MFKVFADAVRARFNEMSAAEELFVVEAAEDLFERYLAAFPPGTDPIFRERTEHDCNCCKQFIRRLGVTVTIKNGQVTTVWGDHDGLPEHYKAVADKLHEYVSSLPISGVFRTKESSYGLDHNYDAKTNERYDHFFGKIANKHLTQNADTERGDCAAIFQVLKRGLSEIRLNDLEAVLDLIEGNNLYRGAEHKEAVSGFRKLVRAYNRAKSKDLFVWENIKHRYARFRNTVIGTLLTDLAEGVDIETAVKSFETKVAPTNYKRTTSIITQKMVEQAVETLNSLGLGGAIYRRYARLSDVSVNDVLFVDNDVKGKLKDGVEALLETSIRKASFGPKNATNISAESFVSTVLPTAKSLELFLENQHTGNFVSVTGADGPERLFKWDNNFAWSYDGDVADSVKARVKAAGGNVDAKLRVSLSWYNTDDLDLHANTPRGEHIYFAYKANVLDVDMNAFTVVRNPVENLAFNQLQDGVYRVSVNQYRRRETTDFGFSIEIESEGVLRSFNYSTALAPNQTVPCFDLTVQKGKLVNTIVKTGLKEGSASQDKWGIKTQSLVPVTAVMWSPNYWGDQKVGAKHLIFALKDCKNPEPTRGIYNEFLRSDLEKHRKVFEVLGAKTKCKPTDDQISGVGFTAARGDTVTVVVDGRRSYTLSF